MKLPTAALTALVLATAAFALDSRIDLRANLSVPMSRARGQAEWQARDRGSRMEAELDVEGQKLPANADFQVTIGSNAPFAITTDSDGQFQLRQRFTTATRPVVNDGDVVTVIDANAVQVLAGTLHVH